MKKRSRGCELPRELLERILLKLPTKCLLQCRTVSKLWNSVITDRNNSDHFLGLRRVAPEMEDGEGGENCSLCGMGRLLFTPIPLYCSCCTRIIKPGVNFYKTQTSETQYSFCNSCYKQPSLAGIPVFDGGHRFQKKSLLVAKNIQEIQESWVGCVKCGARNHKVCSFHNEHQEKPYRCPKCRLDDPGLPAASDLPETVLGNFIQKRLAMRMRRDREKRAIKEGKSSPDEVPGAEDLVVRVAMSSKKTLPVNNALLGILREDNKDYPAEFRYTSKMVLLFQKIEGIDVCIFAMYVHEYGSDCEGPNRRYACISYIDSVKYFTPNISASTGESLRTVAYHEILISYMDYVKRRGFAKFYFWSSPPVKGDQYILNCRPQSQKTPNPERLRQWYLRLLKKATREGIVVNQTTLYDRFFVPREAPITAARLPYFDGDYWPAMTDRILKEIDDQANERAKKAIHKMVTHGSTKVLGITKNVLFMEKLGQAMLSLRQNLMVIDLHHSCDRCHDPILSGIHYTARDCYMCQRCHALMKDKEDWMSRYEIVDTLASDTKDEDGTLENKICDNRHKFLKFCEERYYQFDTLRRTKYSSVMIIQHLLSELPVRSKVALSQNESSEAVEILHHASKCESACKVFGCRSIQAMLSHFLSCKNKTCIVCQKVWYIFHCHSQSCTEPNCQIPYFNLSMKRRK